MAIDAVVIKAIYSALRSHAQETALFMAGTVSHEPLSPPPGGGLSVAVMRGPLSPIRAGGLAATSARLEFTVRIYSSRLREPADDIDPEVLNAECALMASYSAGFDLEADGIPEGLIRMIDLLGAYGNGLASTPGWLNQDGSPQRVVDITVPLILNDAFAQEA